ncbi:hypothetical protein ACFRMQ_00795 [Kitasatospora sp. NPDC056783]|uniref:hypothetical protein n=1 Tax=Kitasatospora sp. NPDC056783 TaxID=3345943 RepID=UPI0036BC10C7
MTSRTAPADRLSDLVADLTQDLHPDLVPPARLARALHTARHFPRDVSGFVGLECRLGPDTAPVDFMFCVGKAPHERAALAHLAERTHRATGPPHPGWGRLADFATAWTDPAGPLHGHIRDVWLEFDLDPTDLDPTDTAPPTPPPPNVFLDIDPGTARSGAANAPLDEATALLTGTAPDPAHRAFLAHCLRSTPTAASGVVLGVLLPRDADHRRLCVQGLTSRQLLDHLDTTAWPGHHRDLLPVLHPMAPTVDCLTLDLDIAARTQDRLGIEYMFRSRLRPGTPPPWERALNRLTALGLCRPQDADALRQFGTARPRPAPGTPPGEARPRTWRRLNHLKVVHTPDRPPEAKCYLFARRTKG